VALYDTIVKNSGKGILIGAGIALATPIILPVVGAIARPLAKGMIRAYFSLADSVRETVAEAGERIGDLVEEAKAERLVAVSDEAAEVAKEAKKKGG
jgi:hypothetical protein